MEKLAVYRCLKCGNVVEVAVVGGGTLVCCGENMKLLDEKSKEGATEKHLPVVEDMGNSFKVKVGTVAHPMDAEHWIQFIEVITKDGAIIRRDLSPGQVAEVIFPMPISMLGTVRAECNKHGLWTK